MRRKQWGLVFYGSNKDSITGGNVIQCPSLSGEKTYAWTVKEQHCLKG